MIEKKKNFVEKDIKENDRFDLTKKYLKLKKQSK